MRDEIIRNEKISSNDIGGVDEIPESNFGQDSSQQSSNKSSMPMIGGILLIIGGVLILAQSIFIITSSETIVSLIDLDIYGEMNLTITPEQMASFLATCGIITTILAIFALLGGILSFKKKTLGLAITGGILGTIAIAPMFIFIPNILCFIGLILIVISRKEFQ